VTDPAAQAAVVRRRLPAPADVVFDEWTDAARLAEWMCPRPARCLNVEADPRVGGTVAFDVEEAGTTFRVSGNYVALERPHRVAFTWSCSTWPDPAIQSVVTVTIEPDGAGASIMTIEHQLLPPSLIPQHAHGWAVIATQLGSRLRATAGAEHHDPQASRESGLRRRVLWAILRLRGLVGSMVVSGTPYIKGTVDLGNPECAF
jgi:uncharacterized protein YndB with AHSA1/START domain